MSLKEIIKKNKQVLILHCVGIVVIIGTLAVLLAPSPEEEQVELSPEMEMELRFRELLERATAGESTTPVQAAPRENPFAGLIDEEIILLSLEERLRIWYEEYGIEVPEKNLDFTVLHEENDHIYAWIYIPNTIISYPIVQHPTTNTHYLYHNIDGSRGWPGAIFTENFNTKTFLDRITVVYGHNIREGTMFKPLHNYVNEEFFEEHPYIFIYTEDDVFVYRVFSALWTGGDHILLEYNLSIDEFFLEYLSNITDSEAASGRGVVDDSIEFTTDSRIIALSTCIEGRPDDRFVVHGILVEREGFYHPRPW